MGGRSLNLAVESAGQPPGAASTAGTSRGRGRSLIPEVPALDGLRGIAIALVLVYHGGFGWSKGGFLGVEVFFVLSGFLITSLLVGEWRSTGRIRLGHFFERRARRLLPALFLLLLAIGLYAELIAPAGSGAAIRGDGLATLFYVANWHQMFADQGYFTLTASAISTPLLHTWSLAIEEQFYIVWPLLVLVLLRWRRSPRMVAAVSAVLAAASAVEMALLADPPAYSRVYYGTDTRAQALLIGAALGAIWVGGRPLAGRISTRSGTVLGAAGLAVVGWATFAIGYQDGWLYRGGFLAIDLAVAGVIAAATLVRSPLISGILSVPPLRALGRISYGLYLWHYPIFLALTRTSLTGSGLFAVQVAVSLAAATVSFYVIEQPVRRGRLLTSARLVAGAPAAALAVAASLLVSTSVGAAAAPGAPSLAKAMQAPPPPAKGIRVLLAGDSIALTLGFGLAAEERHYGVTMWDVGMLGCSYDSAGELEYLDYRTDEQSNCRNAVQTWSADAAKFHVQAVVVEMGYWDAADRTFDGGWTSVGSALFDSYLQSQVEHLIRVLGAGGAAVLLLTVPGTDSGSQPDGQPLPYDLVARHQEVNAVLARAVARFPGRAWLVDINPVVSPGGRFVSSVGGKTIRYDGVHFTTPGGEMLAPLVFTAVRRIVCGASPGAAGC